MDAQQIIALVVPLVGAIFASTGFWNWLSTRHKKQSAADKMLLALGHDRVYKLCRKHLREGEISFNDYDNLLHLFTAYEGLGGNGMAADMMNEVKELPRIK